MIEPSCIDRQIGPRRYDRATPPPLGTPSRCDLH
jgi:hypothetical protein